MRTRTILRLKDGVWDIQPHVEIEDAERYGTRLRREDDTLVAIVSEVTKDTWIGKRDVWGLTDSNGVTYSQIVQQIWEKYKKVDEEE